MQRDLTLSFTCPVMLPRVELGTTVLDSPSHQIALEPLGFSPLAEGHGVGVSELSFPELP
jgi:hypothetical protein